MAYFVDSLRRSECGVIISLGCGLKCEVRLGKDHRHFRSRMDVSVQNMFEINYSQLIQYEILEKLVTFIQRPFFLLLL